MLGTRCVGHITHVAARDGEAVQILVERLGFPVAQFQSDPLRDQRASFELDFSAIATQEEFAREVVTLSAADSAGVRGRLRLSGGSQMELIRRFMGAPHDIVVDLDFSRGGNAETMIGEGWSPPELGFRWTNGRESVLTFAHTPSEGRFQLTVLCSPYLLPPYITEQRENIFINDVLICSFSKDSRTANMSKFMLPGYVFESGPVKTLRMEHLDAVRPSAISNSADNRLLAFSYKKLVITRLHE